MTREELKQEAEVCMHNALYWLKLPISKENVEQGGSYILKLLEPREKQIAELSKHIVELQKDKGELIDRCRELEAQIEKLIDFVLSKTECCDVCPMTDTCINSEGTCPYVGILAKGEEEVTREWLMQFISKEIKEK